MTHQGICLVTGGAGFIGCAMSQQLANSFGRVVAIDSLLRQVHATGDRPALLDPRVELIVGDVTDPSIWTDVLADIAPDVIVHLAAETGTGQSLTEATRHAHVNVVGTTVMLDALVKSGRLPRRIVLSSSRAVYGEGAWSGEDGAVVYPGQRSKAMLEQGLWDFPGLVALPFAAETVTARPTSVYGATKLAQENVLTAWGVAMGVETPILRLQNVYGPGQSLDNPYTGIVPLFARIARSGQAIPVYEDGAIIRDFVFITDVANALFRAVTGHAPGTVPYDVGLGGRTSILELSHLIAKIYDAPDPVINGKYRHGDVRSASCLIERTCRDLEWKPEVGLELGVSRLCQWIDEKQGI